MSEKTKRVLLWALTIFMFLSAIMFFPSVASIFMLLFCIFSLPIEKIQAFWSSKGLKKAPKAVLLSVIFIFSVFLAPTDNISNQENNAPQQIEETLQETTDSDAKNQNDAIQQDDNNENSPDNQIDNETEPQQSSSAVSASKNETAGSQPAAANEEPTTQQDVSSASLPVGTSSGTSPSSSGTSEGTSSSSTSGAPADSGSSTNQEQSRTVYITDTGVRYHYDSKCGNGNFYPTTLDKAISMGLTPCQKCAT